MLTLDSGALALILEEAPKLARDGLETGGYLFGQHKSDGGYCVTAALGPGPKAVRETRSLKHDHDHFCDALARLYPLGHGVLGAWHTHWSWCPEASWMDDNFAWWVIEHWANTPVWHELIVSVDGAGTVVGIRVYRYGTGGTRQELPEIQLPTVGVS